MTPPAFPILPGQGWSVHKRPSFSTRVANHVSGREVRTSLYATTLYEFELTFDGLDSNGIYRGLAAKSLQSLMGLYLQCRGQFGTFLYTDPSDCNATGQAIALGDGVTKQFAFQRTIGVTTEPVSWVTSVSQVKVNSVAQLGNWNLIQPAFLAFTAAPPAGQPILASFNYAFQCRFLEDQEDFEQFLNGLWRVQSLKFRSVKP